MDTVAGDEAEEWVSANNERADVRMDHILKRDIDLVERTGTRFGRERFRPGSRGTTFAVVFPKICRYCSAMAWKPDPANDRTVPKPPHNLERKN